MTGRRKKMMTMMMMGRTSELTARLDDDVFVSFRFVSLDGRTTTTTMMQGTSMTMPDYLLVWLSDCFLD